MSVSKKIKCAFTLAEGTSYCTLLPTKVRFGFTLAEVLITLGIIGVVAAMTIPALLQKNYEKRTITQLKETYSIINQAIRLSSEENGFPEEWGANYDEEGAKIVAEKLKPYLKITVDCGVTDTKSACIDNSKKYKLLMGDEVRNRNDFRDTQYYKVVLLNGSTILFSGGNYDNVPMYALVDTNGKAGPNTWGWDMFEFTYLSNVGLLPSGNPQLSSNDYRKTCSGIYKMMGFGCAYYVLNFGNMDYLHKK